ncbi:tetratricopeptide repeat protein [Leekyejoonella antrihumi]|nr:tetratricopeptide repeat protein [Leekyejoonella antrihumi]
MTGREQVKATVSRVATTPASPRTPLVGRDDEVVRLLRTLAGCRLVTLTGPGGVGKTRLALALMQADATAELAPDGAVTVELSAVSDAALVADTVRVALGVPDAPGRPAGVAIIDRLDAAAALLVLDNCEHLSPAVAELVDALLDGCPRLRVLATSREPLAVDGEALWPVHPFRVPPADTMTAAVVADTASGQLFEQRAQAVRPTFHLTDANAPGVTRVCRRAGGLPLAIELAAARVRVLSVEEIASGLDDMLGLLAGGARSKPVRQKSLRASLDWSNALLNGWEQTVLRRLGVFPGGFDLPAATAVVAGEDVSATELLDLLLRLVDQSLLTAQSTGGPVRYRLLSPIRDYARERLAEAGEQGAVAAAHLGFYADLVDRAEPLLSGPRQTEHLDELELEGNNLRAALKFAAESGAPPAGLRLAAGLERLCAVRGHYREEWQWLDWAATADPGAPEPLRAKALLGAGRLAFLACDYPAAVRRLEAGLRLYRQIGDRPGTVMALHGLGSVARELGRYARAEALYRQALTLAAGDADARQVAQARGYLGFTAWLQGDWQRAVTESEQALRAFRQLGDGEGIVWSLLSLGAVAQYRDEYAVAAEMLGQARELAERLGYREGMAWSLHELGLLALRRGDAAAEELLLDALSRHRALGDRWRTASVLEDLAACAQTTGDHRRSIALLGAAAQIRTAIGTELAPCERPRHDRVDAAARQHLREDDFAAAWLHGQGATLDQLITATATVPSPEPTHGRPPRDVHTTTTAPRLRIRALGACTVHRGTHLLTTADWGYGKPRELFFLLAGSPSLTKANIGTALWPDLDGPQLRNAFHTALRDLRRAVGDPGWILYAAGRYTLDRTREHSSDVEIFQEGLAAARRSKPPEVVLAHLQRAITAYGGEFGQDLPETEWVLARRVEFADAATRALSQVGRLLAAADRYDEAAEIYRRLIERDPLDEAANRHLMICLSRLGEVGQAAQRYQQLTELLRTELGVGPSPETRAVHQRLQAAD